MHSIFKKGHPEAPVFVLLHGTGGDETSLLPIAQELNKQATVLSIRGDVSEKRGEALHKFIQQAANEHQFSLDKIIFIGYSNGANIAIQLLLTHPDSYHQAVLYHPMFPVELTNQPDLTDTSVLLSLGEHDPIVPLPESMRVIQLFQNHGATVQEVWTQSHQLTYQEIKETQTWLAHLSS